MAASAVVAGNLAAALHRRTHRVTSALAHAALEWVLIALLLINGLLTYAIARFADYFGLAPPCLLCSRVDRLFQADGGGAPRLRDVLCGEHAAEISALRYCLSHSRLAETCGMCEGCLSSCKEMRSDAVEKGAAMACSCCQAVVRTSPRVLQDASENHVVAEKITEEEEEEDHGYALLAQEEHDEEEEEHEEFDCQQQQGEVQVQEHQAEDHGYALLAQEEQEEEEDEQEESECPRQQGEVQVQGQQDEKAAAVEDGSLEAMVQGDEIVLEDDRLVPVVALDQMTIADESGLQRDVEEGYTTNRADHEQDPRDVDIGVVLEEKRMLNSAIATLADGIEHSVVPVSAIPHPRTATSDPDENCILQVEDAAEEHVAVPQVTEAVREDDNAAAEVDTNCEVSIGSEICEHESAAVEEPPTPLAVPDDQSSPLESLHDAAPTEQDRSKVEQEKVTDTTRLDHLPHEQNDTPEEDRAPETPTYGVATQRSDTTDRMFLLERKRSLSLSLDGSVASEMDGVEPSSVDQLKSALQAERKALSALYAELEEERNAAAIATNQTMAMINRLQEEKAAMQMEALQYQRMMEEQSEYDQEALQLLNELVTKREREKQELERELELYRQKVQHYEDRERRTPGLKANGVIASPSGSGTYVTSSSEDGDEPSDCELGESPDGGNLQSSSDAALGSMTGQDGTTHLAALDDSLTYFEMERLSILEELKTLEERLFTLEDDDINAGNAAAARSVNDFDLSTDGLRSPPEYGSTSDRTNSGGRISICRGKSLLPLFDAAGDESCDQMAAARVGEEESENSTMKSDSVQEKEQERLAIIEEVDHVYERLQALEADKEFLRHCIKSLKKGDKGMNLLQEILQHLRELRNVDLQVRNAGDAFAANSA